MGHVEDVDRRGRGAAGRGDDRAGTTTKKDTVNEALRKVVDESRGRRARALENLQRIADEGGFNFDLLDELDR